MSFASKFEAQQEKRYSNNYIRFRRHLKDIREIHEANYPPRQNKLDRLARQLDKDVETVNLCASSSFGDIAVAFAEAREEVEKFCGRLMTDKRIDELEPTVENIKRTKDLHNAFLGVADLTLELLIYSMQNVRAANKLLAIASRNDYTREFAGSFMANRHNAALGAVRDPFEQDILLLASRDTDSDEPLMDAAPIHRALSLRAAALHMYAMTRHRNRHMVAPLVASTARTLDRLAVVDRVLRKKVLAGENIHVESDNESGGMQARARLKLRQIVTIGEGIQDGASEFQTLVARQAGWRNDTGVDVLQRDALFEDSQRNETLHMLPWANFGLQLGSAFLYMVSTYAIVPSAGEYMVSLGEHGSMSGSVIALTPFAGFISTIVFSIMSSNAYRMPLLLSGVLCCLGNFLYAFAASFRSLPMALVGRLTIGLGCARVLNRRYIMEYSETYEVEKRYSNFVSISSLGMALGPALSAILSSFDPVTFAGLKFNSETNAAWVCFVLWIAFIFTHLMYFEEPSEDASESVSPALNGIVVYGAVQDMNEGYEQTRSMPGSKPTPWNSLSILLKYPIIWYCLFVLMGAKMVCEILVTSSGLILPDDYHLRHWMVGAFVSCLGLLMFPATMMFQFLFKGAKGGMKPVYVVGLVALGCWFVLPAFELNPSFTRYCFAGVLIFLSSNWVENIFSPITSSMIPAEVNRGPINGAFLVTVSGMIGRALGGFGTSWAGSGPDKIDGLIGRGFWPMTIFATFLVFTTFLWRGSIIEQSPGGEEIENYNGVAGHNGDEDDEDDD